MADTPFGNVLPVDPRRRGLDLVAQQLGDLNEVVECQVEIWATAIVFKKGHKLRLDISPADGVGTQHFTHFHADYNQGETATIYSGGERASYLLLPVIPEKK